MRITLFLTWIALSVGLAGPLSACGITDPPTAPATLLASAADKLHAPRPLRAEDVVRRSETSGTLTAPATQPAAILADVALAQPVQALPQAAPSEGFDIQLDFSDVSAPAEDNSSLPRVMHLPSPSPKPEMLAVTDPDRDLQRLGLLSVLLLGTALVLTVILRVSSAKEE